MDLVAIKSMSSIGRSDELSANRLSFNVFPTEMSREFGVNTAHGIANLNLVARSKSVEETVRRLHQEGLPLARLWQTNSSSLSIGVNPKGKPGLWFVKKLP
jgi:hypothetical protein